MTVNGKRFSTTFYLSLNKKQCKSIVLDDLDMESEAIQIWNKKIINYWQNIFFWVLIDTPYTLHRTFLLELQEERKNAIEENLCRCTGDPKIVKVILAVLKG